MRRALTACTLLLFAACAGPPAPQPGVPRPTPPAAEEDALEALARAIDPGALPAIWAQVPADVRARVERSAPHDKAPAARLAAARERLARWSLQVSTTEPEALAPQLERAFEGVYLAEPLALSPDLDPIALEARGLLWNFYTAFIATQPLLRSFEASWGREAGTKLGSSMEAAELFSSAGAKMSDHLAAGILRAHAPPRSVDEILWIYGSRRLAQGETEGGRALYLELVRRARSAPAREDWLRIAQAYIRLEDPRSAAEAIARAKAAAAPDDRNAEDAARNAESDCEALVRLLALPTDPSPATAVARFDLLIALDRTKDAERVIEPLLRERPRDARARARAILIRVRHGELTDHLVDDLRGDDLTDRTGEYWSMRAGAAGMAIAKSIPTRASLDEIATAAKELAPFEPGRAAVLSFLVDRVSLILDGKPDATAFVRSVRASFDDALALRARFPGTADADRLVLALALFTQDPARGLRAALARPQTSPAEAPDLYLQRANTVVTLAAFASGGVDLAKVREAVEDLRPGTEPRWIGAREALLGDVSVLEALGHGPPAPTRDSALWNRARKHYLAATLATRDDRARIENNLGYIAGLEGQSARAASHYQVAAREKSGRPWVTRLNQVTAPGVARDEQLAAVRAMGPADAAGPALVNIWRAALEPAAGDASAAATAALLELDGALSLHKIALHTKGLETEGTFSLGLGLRTGHLSHALSASAYATLWLVRPMPISRAELEARAKPSAPAKPAPRRR